MKFLVDAQLPKALSIWITSKGVDRIHILDLPDKNKTTDTQINNLSIKDQYVVITKDSDFFDSFIIKKVPFKLLLVTTGNLSNEKLLLIFEKNFNSAMNLLLENNVVEITQTELLIHF